MAIEPVDKAFEFLTDAAALDATDLDGEVAERQSRNFFTHAASLAMTKSADGLIDPKLVLSWLLNHLGAPVFLVGLLVPVREAGALLPQMPLAAMLSNVTVRKWIWVAGSLVQGLAAAAIGLAAIFFDGAWAGAVIVACVGALALARSACSLSYKDILGKTVARSARGTATGVASSLAAGIVILFGIVLTAGILERRTLVISGIFLAAILWAVAAFLLSTLFEKPAGVSGGRSEGARLASLQLLRDDRQLRIFVITRGLLVSTALAPPFLVTMAGKGEAGGYGALGLLVLASATASLLSSYVWGRIADRSSRLSLIIAGTGGAASLLAAVLLDAAGYLSAAYVLPVTLFAVMISYHGVRLGRSTHLVDMAPADLRSAYTALSNTLIGALVIAGGALSAVAAVAGAGVAVLLLAGASLAAAGIATRLEEVQS